MIRAFFTAIGRPLYKLLFSKRRSRVIYRAPSPLLKPLLKLIYPLIFHPKFSPHHPVQIIKSSPKLKIRNWLLVIVPMLSLFSIFYFLVLKDLPSPSSLSNQPIALTTHIRDRHGTELYKIYRNQNRTPVKLNDLPLHLRQATISIEDKEFYSHSGFSLRGITRATWRTFTNQSLEGGSTITQQLVKTALLSPERTVRRKLRELFLAIAVELSYSKDQILEMYLNQVSYGGTFYGVEEAAQSYFGKPARDLDLAESALLAGLPASPTTYSPFGAHPELAKARQKEVLRRMAEDRHITWEQAETASAQELHLHPPAANIKAPHFVMYVREVLAQKYGTDVVEQGGLDVITSLDLEVQETAQKIVAEETAKVTYLRVGNGAALVTRPATGEILAMVGSRDYFDTAKDGNVNVTTSPRQPGSSIKPINYALAFIRGLPPAYVIDDAPITYRTAGQPSYSPLNYDRKFHGKMTLRSALANSYNVPAVKVLALNGIHNMIDLAEKMGITTWGDRNRFGLSLTLGGGEVKITDMAVAYGVFANSGARVDLTPILSVRDSKGNLLEEFRCPGLNHSATINSTVPTEVINCTSQPVLDPKVAYIISDILSDNVARTPVFGGRSLLFIPGNQVAVKTGTTNDLRDNWTIGYTPDFVVGVWVGNNDNSPMSYVASGITGASPIWRHIVDHLLKKYPATGFKPPSDLLRVNICTITGELACSGCPTRTEYFIPGTQPKKACSSEAIQKILEERAKASPSPSPNP